MSARSTLLTIIAFSFAVSAASIQIAQARTWHILPDGTGDAPAIQAGIDLASVGDTILVAPGRYTGPGNTNLDCGGTDLVLLSEAGATATFIDCENESNTRGLRFINGETSAAVVDGFTFENGNRGVGAGIFCTFSSPTITNCIFRKNEASFQGGGFYCSEGSSPTITHCIFAHNTADYDGGGAYTKWSVAFFSDCIFEDNEVWEYMSWGGGLHSYEASTTVSNCSFANNEAYLGGGLFCLLGPPSYITECTFTENSARQGGGLLCTSAGPISITDCTFSGNMASNTGAGLSILSHAELNMSKTIVTFNTGGQGVNNFGTATLHCCDIFGNAGGDWVGGIADQYGVDGNFSADPLFCDAGSRDFSLRDDSPCLPGNHPDGYDCGGTIGAWPEGCPASTVTDQALTLSALSLGSGVPNPFHHATEISYGIPSRAGIGQIRIDIYDPAGRLIRTLVNTSQPAGTYRITWDGRNQAGEPVAGGVYFHQLRVNGERLTRQVVLIR